MINKTIDLKSQWVRKLFLATSIASFGIITTFASPAIGSAETIQSQSAISNELLQKQSEIDSYVFEKHVDDLADQGIQVTNTGPVGNVVEIGILDYTNEKAEYLYGIFGTELVKVVEGQQAVLFDSASSSSAGDPQSDINDVLLQKQSEIDAYVFEQHADDLAAQEIQVTNTGAVGDVIEIGILNYTKEKADYLYDIFGTDQVKVVEGQQAVVLENTELTTTAAVDSGATDKAGNSGQTTAWIAAIIILILGAFTLFSRKIHIFKK